MLRVQSLDHNIITGTLRIETCTIAGPNAKELEGRVGRGGPEHDSVGLGHGTHNAFTVSVNRAEAQYF